MDEEVKLGGLLRRQGSSFNNRTISSVANSINTNTTTNEEAIEEKSNESS